MLTTTKDKVLAAFSTAMDRFKLARTHMLLKEPFYAWIALKLDLIEDTYGQYCQTACTNGKMLIYYPPYVEALEMEDLITLVAEEAMHVAYKHHLRRGTRDPELWNVACDVVIFNMLEASGFTINPEFCIYMPEYAGQSVDQVYADLAQNQQNQQNQQNGGKDGNNTDGTDGSDDSDSDSTSNGNSDSAEEDQEAIEDHSASDGNDDAGSEPTDEHANDESDHSGTSSEDYTDGSATDNESDGRSNGNAEDGDETPGGSTNGSDTGNATGSGSDPQRERRDFPQEPVKAKSGGVFDLTEEDGNPLSEADRNAESEEVDLMVLQATQVAKKRGTAPGFALAMVEEMQRPKQDWKSILRQFFSRVMPHNYTMRRPNRAYRHMGLYLPSVEREGVGGVVVHYDRSGSISAEENRVFASELKSIFEDVKPKYVLVIYFDAANASVIVRDKRYQLFRSYDEFELRQRGGGGTDFRPSFEAFPMLTRELRLERPKCHLVFTDMECNDFPPRPGEPVLWCSTQSEKTVKGSSYAAMPPWGKFLYIDV